MKRKNSPFFLMAVVAVALILIGMTNAGLWENLANNKHKSEDSASSTTAKEATAQDKNNMAKSIAMQTKKGAMDPEDETPKFLGIPERPTILIEKKGYIKPQQNESAVSSGWYKSESQTEQKAEELAKKRGN